MRQLRVILGTSVLVALVVVAVQVTSSAGGQTLLASQVMTVSQLEEVGLRLEAVPVDAVQARVSAADATRIAGELEGRDDPPAEVLRIMVRQYDGSPLQSAYLVIYRGGPDLPGGPEGKALGTAFSGVVIDDQTGEFLRGFYYGGPNL